MKRNVMLGVPVVALTIAAIAYWASVASGPFSETSRVALISGGLAAFATLFVAYVGWIIGTRQDEARREHERLLAREARLFERLAPAYEQILVQLNQAWQTMNETLPFFLFGSASPDPYGSLSEEEKRDFLRTGQEQASRVDALVVAYGSPELKALLVELRPIQQGFWGNVLQYRAEIARKDPRVTERYADAHRIRERCQPVIEKIRAQVGDELRGLM